MEDLLILFRNFKYCLFYCFSSLFNFIIGVFVVDKVCLVCCVFFVVVLDIIKDLLI